MGQQVGSDVSNRGGWGSGEGVPLGESSVHAIEAVGMDGWMARWTCGWEDIMRRLQRVESQEGGQGHPSRQINTQKDRRMPQQTPRRTSKHPDRQPPRRTDRHTNAHVDTT